MTVSYLDFHSDNHGTLDRTGLTDDKPLSLGKLGQVELEFVSSDQYDRLAGMFSDIIPEQMGSYNSGHWGKENLEFIKFTHAGEILGGAAVIVKKVPFTNTGIAILKWGPIIQKTGKDFDPILYSRLISRLKEEYCVQRNFHLTVMPIAKPVVSEESESILTVLGFDEGETLPAPERYLVNVQDEAETLLKNLDQKWRYNLRKALKNQFDIRVVSPGEGLGEFLSLYSQMLDRKKFHDSSAIGALEQVVKASPRELQPMIVLVSHDGKVTAGGVFHVAGDMAIYMFGATDDRALKLKAGYALHWWVAEYLISKESVSWYDLGGNDRDKGLHQFKKGFVGKSGHVLISPPRYHFASSYSAKFVGYAAFKARELIGVVKRLRHQIRKTK